MNEDEDFRELAASSSSDEVSEAGAVSSSEMLGELASAVLTAVPVLALSFDEDGKRETGLCAKYVRREVFDM